MKLEIKREDVEYPLFLIASSLDATLYMIFGLMSHLDRKMLVKDFSSLARVEATHF